MTPPPALTAATASALVPGTFLRVQATATSRIGCPADINDLSGRGGYP